VAKASERFDRPDHRGAVPRAAATKAPPGAGDVPPPRADGPEPPLSALPNVIEELDPPAGEEPAPAPASHKRRGRPPKALKDMSDAKAPEGPPANASGRKESSAVDPELAPFPPEPGVDPCQPQELAARVQAAMSFKFGGRQLECPMQAGTAR